MIESYASDISISDIPTVIEQARTCGITPVFSGESGIGKTYQVRLNAEQRNHALVEVNLAHVMPEDFGCIRDVDEYVSFKFNEILKERDRPTCLFLDEAGRCKGDVRNIVAGIISERKLFGKTIPDNIYAILATNPAVEEYGDNEDFFVDLATLRRVSRFDVTVEADTWLAWAASHEVASQVIRFIAENKLALIGGGACPRQWVKMSNLIIQYGVDPAATFAAGTVAQYAKPFVQFLGEIKTVTVQDILTRYSDVRAELIKDKAAQVAVASELAHAKWRKTSYTSIVAFWMDMPEEARYAAILEAIKSKTQVVAGMIEKSKPLTDFVDSCNWAE